MADPFVFIAERSVPELGMQAGERIVVRPDAAYPVIIQRDIAHPLGTLLLLLLMASESGELRALSPTSLSALRAAVESDAPPLPTPRTQSGRPPLVVLR